MATPPVILSDYAHLHHTHHTSGYRDGVALARNQSVQPSFDNGYQVGAHYGLRVGYVIGLMEVALAGGNHSELFTRAKTELDLSVFMGNLELEKGIEPQKWHIDFPEPITTALPGGSKPETSNIDPNVADSDFTVPSLCDSRVPEQQPQFRLLQLQQQEHEQQHRCQQLLTTQRLGPFDSPGEPAVLLTAFENLRKWETWVTDLMTLKSAQVLDNSKQQ